MAWRLAPMIGLLAGLAPAAAYAQTDIDQGKTPAQMFASDCAVCHKAPRGLAKGRNSLMLSSYLREHYTTGREQAAALAAYVLGAGNGPAEPATQGRGQKPAAERAKAAEESKGPARARLPGKPEERGSATAKLQRPADADAKPDEEPDSGEGLNTSNPARRPAVRREVQPATATRGRGKDTPAATAVREPAAVVAEPTSTEARTTETRTPEISPPPSPARSAAAPLSTEPEENSTVPRDNIPD